MNNQQGVQHRMVLVVNFVCLLFLNNFCFVVGICDLVHDVKAICHLPLLLTACGNLFCNMCNALEITQISEKNLHAVSS